MKANGVMHVSIQTSSYCKNLNIGNEYVGYTMELKTCETIEEGLKSFDKKKKIKKDAEQHTPTI